MIYLSRLRSPRLAGIVERLWYVEAAGAANGPETICPDGCAEIVIHLGEPMQQQPRYLLVGQMSSPLTIIPTGRVKMVGARLSPTGLHRLLPIPQKELAGQVARLDAVWAAWMERTAQQIDAARRPDAALDAFECALEELVRSSRISTPTIDVDRAVMALREHDGNVSVSALAAYAGISRRQFERSFQEQVGLSPRLYARIVRFQKAFQALGTDSGAAIAARYGYADQAHLVREVRRFGGATPSALAAADGLTTFFRQ